MSAGVVCAVWSVSSQVGQVDLSNNGLIAGVLVLAACLDHQVACRELRATSTSITAVNK